MRNRGIHTHLSNRGALTFHAVRLVEFSKTFKRTSIWQTLDWNECEIRENPKKKMKHGRHTHTSNNKGLPGAEVSLILSTTRNDELSGRRVSRMRP